LMFDNDHQTRRVEFLKTAICILGLERRHDLCRVETDYWLDSA